MFLSSCRDTRKCLGEREMMWDHEPQGTDAENMFSTSFRKYRDSKKKK